MTTGDAQDQQAPLNPGLLPGKVLRLNANGTIPANNPTPGSYVYSLGHRNAQGMFRHPNGRIYISEHGPSSDDELNIIEPGRNYGWPTVNGMCNTPAELQYCAANNVYEPIRTWTPTIAPAGMIWYNHAALPVFQNKIILTTLKNARLYVLSLNENGDSVTAEAQYLNQMFGRLRDVIADPAGNLYLATNGNSWVNSEPFTHRIVKLSPRVNTSVSAVREAAQASVYPNPLTAESRLQLDASLVGSTASLYDLQGRLLHQFEVKETTTQLHVPVLQPGIYYLQLSKHQKAIKLLVQ
jgi:glucose/arabinose dehydrogenase